MIRSLLIAALAATSTTTAVSSSSEELYTIELAPGVVKQVTETEKYALKAVSEPNHPVHLLTRCCRGTRD
jgi:hypothetical protein